MLRKLSNSLFACVIAAVLLVAPNAALGQSTNPKLEFRGAWIATVINLDWPSRNDLTTSQQQQELTTMMDNLAAAGINAVFFQIRSESDAFYESDIEPWSRHLTGSQGRAPSPFYDPLEFAVQLAHDRGMELHAWFNPFRVRRNISDGTNPDPLHVTQTHPEWVIGINNIQILDPGIPDARAYVVEVIDDVMRRYDIDGIHFDDYFYPYPPNEIGSADVDTYNLYGGAFSNIVDWRIDNINRFVKEVSDQIMATKPDLKYGISPFGIWKNGVPNGITGMSAVDVIFADAPAWMAAGSIDYLVPQLYWPFDGAQDFSKLAPWWASVANETHIYPGVAAYKLDSSTYSGTLYGSSEVPNQVRFSRDTNGVEGQVFFRAENLNPGRSKGLADSLQNDLFNTKALTPPYLTARHDYFFVPAAPENLSGVFTTSNPSSGFGLQWDPSLADPLARKYGVYRVRSGTPPVASEITSDPANLLKITYEPFAEDDPEPHPEPYYYVVTGITANSIEGDESNIYMVNWTGLPVETTPDASFRISSVYPNPVTTTATVEYDIDRSSMISLSIYDALGREVDVLVNQEFRPLGTNTESVDFSSRGRRLSSGVYFLVLTSESRRISHPVMLLR